MLLSLKTCCVPTPTTSCSFFENIFTTLTKKLNAIEIDISALFKWIAEANERYSAAIAASTLRQEKIASRVKALELHFREGKKSLPVDSEIASLISKVEALELALALSKQIVTCLAVITAATVVGIMVLLRYLKDLNQRLTNEMRVISYQNDVYVR